MLMIKERTPAIRTLRGWAISVLQEAGAIHECETHGWMRDRTDPHAREPSTSAAWIRRPTSRRTKRAPRSPKCSTQSVIPAPSATNRRPAPHGARGRRFSGRYASLPVCGSCRLS
jgi:hypothetical protein